MELKPTSVFVTVGTTRFDELISEISTEKIIKRLIDLGCERLVIQLGAGEIPEELVKNSKKFEDSIDVSHYRYKNTLQNDIDEADLIISHCGSGTIFECLKMKKRIVAVINETLMDNHQCQLANVMHEKNHLMKTIPIRLGNILGEKDFLLKMESLEEIGEPETYKFANVVYDEIGIIHESEEDESGM